MNNIVSFDFKGLNVRTNTDENGEPWFVASDVCKILEIRNTSDAIKRLDQDEVTLDLIEGSHRQTNLINESGLYGLVLRSDKPNARKFRKWITSEVLPAIRKNGSYGSVNLSDPAALRQTLLGYTEKVMAQQRVIDEQAPIVAAHDRIANSDGLMCITDAAKTLGIGPRQLTNWLSGKGLIYKRAGNAQWIAYQQYIQQGIFEHKSYTYEKVDGLQYTATRALVTPKGLAKFAEILSKEAA
ncbi:MAG: phage antirepressor KilAC domain-containing protein [Kordiimonadaceae bacterium]|nr:phage antirepressor KilAC domain-containing protein [Kordiimonadaceae bacterium]